MQKIFITTLFLIFSGMFAANLCAQSDKSYAVKNGAITGYNTGRYNNRPLYINNTNAFVLTGDQPLIRLAKDQFLFGSFMVAIERNGKSK